MVGVVQSGIHTLPLILRLTVTAIASGGAVTVFGYYTPLLILGSCIMATGSGLLYTLKPDVSTASYVGYQIIFGSRLGMSFEQCNIEIETVLPKEQIPAGISLGFLVLSPSDSIAVAICQNVIEHKLMHNLAEILPNADISVISGSGATTLVSNILVATGGKLTNTQNILKLYNDALLQIFLVALIMGAVTLSVGLLVEWNSFKKEKKEKPRM